MSPSKVISVRSSIDVFEVRRSAAQLATGAGFENRGRQCVEIVASELSTNIVKYGVEGSVSLEITDDPSGPGLRLVACDRGPPIVDLQRAMRDGSDAGGPLDPAAYWGRKGIGSGLGAIARLSDAFHYEHTLSGNRFVVLVLREAARRRQPWRVS